MKFYKEDIGDRVSNRRYHRPGVSLETAGRSDGHCLCRLFLPSLWLGGSSEGSNTGATPTEAAERLVGAMEAGGQCEG